MEVYFLLFYYFRFFHFFQNQSITQNLVVYFGGFGGVLWGFWWCTLGFTVLSPTSFPSPSRLPVSPPLPHLSTAPLSHLTTLPFPWWCTLGVLVLARSISHFLHLSSSHGGVFWGFSLCLRSHFPLPTLPFLHPPPHILPLHPHIFPQNMLYNIFSSPFISHIIPTFALKNTKT